MNFLWAVVYNVVLIPVAAGVFFWVGATEDNGGGWRLAPVWAAAAMAGSSVSVVVSSLALRLPEVKFESLMKLLKTSWSRVCIGGVNGDDIEA